MKKETNYWAKKKKKKRRTGRSGGRSYSGVGEPDGPGVAILLGDGASGGLILMKNPNPGVLGPLLGLGLQLGCGNRSALHLL